MCGTKIGCQLMPLVGWLVVRLDAVNAVPYVRIRPFATHSQSFIRRTNCIIMQKIENYAFTYNGATHTVVGSSAECRICV